MQTASQLILQLERGQTTSVQIVQDCLQTIRQRDGRIHAFLEVYEKETLEAAAQSDARRAQGKTLSPLDGVPVAVKDNLVMRGHVCSCASKMLQNFVSPYDATVIARLRQAGMPILGRLNMDEFAMGGSTENSAFGPSRNPVNEARVPGGSSGGAAAAVAAGMVPWALGSDTGGSVRQPAAFCGVVGVKPAYGAVSRYGLVAFSSSMDQVGIIAQTAGDAALLMNVLCGQDEHDMTTDPALAQPCWPLPPVDFAWVRLALPEECFQPGLDAQVRQAVERAADTFVRLGASVEQVSIPMLRHALSAYYVLSSAEASSNLARYDGVRYGYRAPDCQTLEEMYVQTRRQGFGPEVKRRLLMGTFALSSGYQQRYYLKAMQVREQLRQQMDLPGFDALLTPTAPTVAYPLGQRKDPEQLYLGDLYTVPANLAGLPALSIPCGTDNEGMPIGLQLTGGRLSLPRLLALADGYQEAKRRE
ncbi:MAG: Asp-tRNA(Asn)/Glu-tRNA(Gln) amidotransferase subunit GatA [Candidatus Limiplasma sp.]|nr:Asp-tRNA(Asn)/Glu-tRNA(Gln) amidotransferase subunit GatA [Candidatus Limiplasma sp.]